MTDQPNDFYEDDEPVEDVVAAFEAGPHGVTQRPMSWLVGHLTDSIATEAAIGEHRVSVLEVFPHVRQAASQGNTTSAARRSA